MSASDDAIRLRQHLAAANSYSMRLLENIVEREQLQPGRWVHMRDCARDLLKDTNTLHEDAAWLQDLVTKHTRR